MEYVWAFQPFLDLKSVHIVINHSPTQSFQVLKEVHVINFNHQRATPLLMPTSTFNSSTALAQYSAITHVNQDHLANQKGSPLSSPPFSSSIFINSTCGRSIGSNFPNFHPCLHTPPTYPLTPATFKF